MKEHRQLKKIIAALLFGVAGFFLATLVFTEKEAALVGLIAFLVTLWTNEGLPLGVVSLLPIILFPSFDILFLWEYSVSSAQLMTVCRLLQPPDYKRYAHDPFVY